jgi:signal transduction histidine kinase
MRNALNDLHFSMTRMLSEEEREKDPQADKNAARADRSYYQLLRLVNSLSMAGWLTDDTPLSLQDRDIVDLVGNVCDKAGDLAPYLGLELRFICAPESYVCAVAPDALEQLLYHLLSNAFKFTPSGGTVTVELQIKEKQIFLSVADTGCGIPEERMDTLFSAYLQKGKMDPLPHGLGLGLALCQCIARRHGGMMMAQSHVGKGSRFTLSLPNRQLGTGVSDVRFDYAGGFNKTLMSLADALPSEAFCLRNQ